MAWEEEEEGMAASSEEEEDVVVGQMSTVMVPKHIKKRSLKNKALSVSLDKKALRDFVTGFHKRKKKRRKEAQRVIEEKERRKRIGERKRRKQDKEIALYGRVLSSDKGYGETNDVDTMETNDDLSASAPEIKTYEDDGTRITVTTSEIAREDDDLGPRSAVPLSITNSNKKSDLAGKKNSSLGVKKKPSKRTFRNKSKMRRGDKKRGAAKGKRKNKGKN